MASSRALSFALLFTLGCDPVTVLPDVPRSDAPIDLADGGLDSGLDGGLDGGQHADAAPFTGLTYLEDVHPVFEAAGCSTFACHGSTVGGSGLLLYMPTPRVAYDDLLERVSVRSTDLLVHAGAPDESLLVRHAEEDLVRFEVLTAEGASLVRRWVADGAVYSREGGGGDAGVRDAGVGGSDGGVGEDAGVPLVCALDAERGWSPLPSSCLPRCTQTTWDAILACRTAADPSACQDAAIAMDTTPPTSATGASDVFPIDCNVCLSFQTRSCIEEACLFPLLAFDRCATLTPDAPCTSESVALNDCRVAHPEVQACQRARDPLCVEPG